MTANVMTIETLRAFLAQEFPQAFFEGSGLSIEMLDEGGCALRQAYHPSMLRPGETVSGPTMMSLADIAMYVAVLAKIGPVGLAVTTNFSINFLRKPPAGHAIIAQARLMKLGQRLAVSEATVYSDGVAEPVAHSTSTYSIPKRGG